jgi:hypothetical protein
VQFDSPFHPECSNPNRPTNLVSGEGSEVYPPSVEVNRDVAKGLDGVGMHERPSLVGRLSDPRDGLASSGLVVDSHDGNNVKIAGVSAHLIRVDKPGMVHR